jgi:hypothetical protein
MNQQSKSREVIFVAVLVLTVLFWVLRGLGLLTFIPGVVLWILLGLSIALIVANGLIETR